MVVIIALLYFYAILTAHVLFAVRPCCAAAAVPNAAMDDLYNINSMTGYAKECVAFYSATQQKLTSSAHPRKPTVRAAADL